MISRTEYRDQSQRGIALVTALIFLVVISLISISSMRTSRIELRMAANAEARSVGFQSAQAMLDVIANVPSTTPVIGDAGYLYCTAGQANCNRADLTLPNGLYSAEITAGDLSARIERMDPEERPPPRGVESSLDKFSAAPFEVRVTYDRADERGGRVTMADGLLVLIPRSN